MLDLGAEGPKSATESFWKSSKLKKLYHRNLINYLNTSLRFKSHSIPEWHLLRWFCTVPVVLLSTWSQTWHQQTRNIPSSSTSNRSLLSVRSVLILSLQEFDHDSVSGWMEENWVSVCSWSSLLYLVMVLGGSAVMRDRSVSDCSSSELRGFGYISFILLFKDH